MPLATPGLALALAVTAIRFSSDGNTLAVAAGNQVRLVPVLGGVERTLTSRLAQVFAVAWSNDNRWLAVGGGSPAVSGAVELYDARTLQLQRIVARSGDLIYAAAFSPDSARLAAASADQRVVVAAVSSGETLFRLTGHVGPVLAVRYSPDGASIATAGADRSIRLWNAAAGSLERALTNHNGPVEALAFSPDSKTLYSASSDATLRVWDQATGRMKRILRGFDQPVLALDFVPSRQLLVSGAAGGALRFTNPDTGEHIETIQAAGWIQTVAVSPDGSRIAWADTTGHFNIRSVTP